MQVTILCFLQKMDKIFTDVLDLCSARMMKHGVDLQLILPDQNLKLYAREVQIDQVLVNLINNAFDAIAPLKEKWIRIEAIQKNEGPKFLSRIVAKGFLRMSHKNDAAFYNQRNWQGNWSWTQHSHGNHQRSRR